jgi:hypothetical protein
VIPSAWALAEGIDARRGRAVGALFSYVDLEARVGKDHPLRTIRMVVNAALAGLSGEFSALYGRMGHRSAGTLGVRCVALAGMVKAWLRVGRTARLGEVSRRWTSQLGEKAAFCPRRAAVIARVAPPFAGRRLGPAESQNAPSPS